DFRQCRAPRVGILQPPGCAVTPVAPWCRVWRMSQSRRAPSRNLRAAQKKARQKKETYILQQPSRTAMKRLFATLVALAIALFSIPSYAANEARASEPEAEAMVKKAIAFYKKNGKEKSMAEFQKNPGPFVDRDLYMTVYTMNADALSHINPKMVGKNMMDLRDADGKYHIK